MALETTKHFDAPLPPSALQASLGLVAARWGTFVALVVLTAAALLAAGGIVVAAALAHAAGDAALRATGIVVLVEPQASAADAESVGAAIRSIPGVAEASFRSKEEALKDLTARGLPTPDGRNPLPDAWVLRLAATGDEGPAPGERLAGVVRAAASLPHVAGARLDDRWVAQLDRTDERRRRFAAPLQLATFAALALLVFCAGVLGGGSLSASAGGVDQPSKSALALFSLFVALTAAVVVSAVYGMLAMGPNLPGVEGVQSLRQAVEADAPASALRTMAGVAVTAAVLGLGLALGARRRR